MQCGHTPVLLIRVKPDKFTSGGDIEDPPVIPGVSLLVTAAHEVELWWCSLDRQDLEIERSAEWLAPDEHARAQRFGTNLLRDRYVAARATLRLLLGYALGVPPEAVPLRRGPRGRPSIAGETTIDFNVSHTQNVALIGVARNAAHFRIGVDVERIDRRVDADRLARKFLTADEACLQIALTPNERRENFLRYWTCKEAMSKATGDGLIAPFRHLGVELADPPRLIAGPPPYVPERWRLHTVAVPSG